MKKTALKHLFLSITILLMLCGCFEKSFENKNLSFKGASDFDLVVGKSKQLTAVLPDNGVKTTLSASTDREELSVSISDDNTVTLTASAVGEYELTFTLSAKGYKPANAVFTAHVSPADLPVSVFIDGDAVSEKIALDYGETVEITVKHNIEAADFSISTADSSIVDISGSKNKYSITAKAVGSSLINISSPLPQYKDISIPVKVNKIKADFTLSAQNTAAVVGENIIFDCQYPTDSRIYIQDIPQDVSVSVNGNKVIVTSAKQGQYDISVCCEGENYTKTVQTVSVKFALPQLKFSAPASLTMVSGDSTSFSLSGYPEGTTFSVSSGGKAAVSISSNKVSVTARAAGSDTITVTAKKQGYQSHSLKIPVTINAVSVKVSSKYDSQIEEIIRLVNKERTSRGISALTYLSDLAPGCTLRAEEASEKWSHTRPNGGNWETVLYDTGVSFKSGGENLLEMNSLNPKEAVKAWMNSQGHKENILRPNFNATCVAIYKDGENYYYAQHFIER